MLSTSKKVLFPGHNHIMPTWREGAICYEYGSDKAGYTQYSRAGLDFNDSFAVALSFRILEPIVR